jgi:DNA repair protein RadC
MSQPLAPRPPGDLANIVALLAAFRADPQEHLWVFALDASEPPCIASVDLVSKGHHNTQVVTAAEILRPVIVSGCNRFALAHNHPIDSALPTAQDIALTGRIRELARQLGLDLLEHVILSRIDAYSFAAQGLI